MEGQGTPKNRQVTQRKQREGRSRRRLQEGVRMWLGDRVELFSSIVSQGSGEKGEGIDKCRCVIKTMQHGTQGGKGGGSERPRRVVESVNYSTK